MNPRSVDHGMTINTAPIAQEGARAFHRGSLLPYSLLESQVLSMGGYAMGAARGSNEMNNYSIAVSFGRYAGL
jgi:hypothetical protein